MQFGTRKDINDPSGRYLRVDMWFNEIRSVLVLVLLAGLTFDSCKKKDELPPEIDVQFPTAGATYQIPDTINVGLIVTDETDLTNLEVKLIGPDNLLASDVASIDPSGNRFEGVLTIVVSDKYLPTGDYSIHIRARDGTNERFRFIEVNVNELPKKRRGLLALTGGLNNSSVYHVDSSGSVNLLHSLDQDAGYLCVDNRNDQCVVSGKTSGAILGVSIETSSVHWTNTGFHQPPPYCSCWI